MFLCDRAHINVLFSHENVQYIVDFNQLLFWLDFTEFNVDNDLMYPEREALRKANFVV